MYIREARVFKLHPFFKFSNFIHFFSLSLSHPQWPPTLWREHSRALVWMSRCFLSKSKLSKQREILQNKLRLSGTKAKTSDQFFSPGNRRNHCSDSELRKRIKGTKCFTNSFVTNVITCQRRKLFNFSPGVKYMTDTLHYFKYNSTEV